MRTRWLGRSSSPAPAHSVAAISRVVRTAAPASAISVRQPCSASATMTVPSANSTSKQGRPVMTSVAATTVVGRPSAPISWSPTATSAIVVQPVGVTRAVSSASALPTAGRAASTIIWPGCSPLVSSSKSANPVGTPTISPPREPIASISSSAPSMIADSGR